MGPVEARQDRIRSWIERTDPDLIGLQEVLVGQGIDQLTAITDGLGYHTDHAAATEYDGLGFGNAVCSRWPITAREVLELPKLGNDETRCALSVTVNAPVGEISFTTTHLNWKLHDARTRERQVVALAEHVVGRRPRGGFPPIVVGDFNAEPDSSEIRYMRGLHAIDGGSVMFYDAWSVAGDGSPGHTWINDNPYAAVALEPDRRIDYIFAGYPIRMDERHGVGHIESCRVVCDDEEDGVWPSDHLGLLAELRTEPLPTPSWMMG